MPNQHKPLPPDEDIRECAEFYWGKLGLPDKEVVSLLEQFYDTEKYSLSARSFRRLRNKWQLRSTRQQQHSLESISASIDEIRKRFPTMGARTMVVELRQNYGIRAPEKLVAAYLKLNEPEAVRGRKGRQIKRRLFWCAGVNDMWCFDQHDKWRRFGLFLHIGGDPCPGEILWLKVWWTNRNPRLITSYYLDAARSKGGVPLVTQSDPGSENYGIAYCHTNIRHKLDESLEGTSQHRWMRDKQNIKPEILWSLVRRIWSPGMEDVLQKGLDEGKYDPANILQKLTFLWLAIPWIQAELDAFRARFNMSARRADPHKLTPQGIPVLISANPERFNVRDYKVLVQPELFDEMEAQWAPKDNTVFERTPPEFDAVACEVYASLGTPSVTLESFWDVYDDMLHVIEALPIANIGNDVLQSEQSIARSHAHEFDMDSPEVQRLRGLRELEEREAVISGRRVIYGGGLERPPAHMLPLEFESDDEEVEVDETAVVADLTPPGSPIL